MAPGNDHLVVTTENPHDDECQTLMAQLLGELSEKYPDELINMPLVPEDLTVPGAAFLVAKRNGRPVGCGAIRPHAPGVAEVKRMFVVQEARGYGIGRVILESLEAFAKNFGYKSVRLETGLKQPEAINLYESAGYHRAPCYEPFQDNPMSVCFEKELNYRTGSGSDLAVSVDSTGRVRRNGQVATASVVECPRQTPLLVAQCFNRIQRRGLSCRVVAKKYSHGHREDH